jgi:hypothetical protein
MIKHASDGVYMKKLRIQQIKIGKGSFPESISLRTVSPRILFSFLDWFFLQLSRLLLSRYLYCVWVLPHGGRQDEGWMMDTTIIHGRPSQLNLDIAVVGADSW